MSLQRIREVFSNLSNCTTRSLELLTMKSSLINGISYETCEVNISPEGKLLQFVEEIASLYLNKKLEKYENVCKYDGGKIGGYVYKLSVDNSLISNNYHELLVAIADPASEIEPLDFKANAYLIQMSINIGDNETSVKMISLQNPITSLKHKFFYRYGDFEEISDKVLNLRQIMDVLIVDNTVYMLSIEGEKLFDLERSYKTICSEKLEEIAKNNIVNDDSIFKAIAAKGHNPRKFLAFEHRNLEKLLVKKERRKIAKQFNIPMDGDKFDVTKEDASEKIIKLLCNKAMLDPFFSEPKEVAGSRNWE